MSRKARPSHESAPSQPFDERTARMVRRKALQLQRLPEFRGADPDDLAQDLALKVWKSTGRFDPGRACWHGFVSIVLDRQAANLLRDRRRAKRRRGRTVSLHSPLRDGGELLQLLAEELLGARLGIDHRPFTERADPRLDVTEVLARDPAELRHLAPLLRSRGVLGLAKVLGVPPSTLRDRLRRLACELGRLVS